MSTPLNPLSAPFTHKGHARRRYLYLVNYDSVPFSEALDRVLKGLRGPDRRQVGGLFGRWEEIVGDVVARHVRPVRLESKVLVVEVDEPAWATQFEFLSGQVVDRLRAEVGVEVDRLETRVARRG